VLHLIEKAGRTDEVKGGGSVEAQPQQAIEARKMIHVGVRNERMRDAQEFARGQRRHVAEVEQQGAAAETEIDEQRRIRKRIIDEPRLHEPSHFLPPSRSIGANVPQAERGIVRDKGPGEGPLYALFDCRK
jgi:hypothetical protein